MFKQPCLQRATDVLAEFLVFLGLSALLCCIEQGHPGVTWAIASHSYDPEASGMETLVTKTLMTIVTTKK